VNLARGIQQETDANYSNDSTSGANALSWTTNDTHQTATIAGTIMAPGDSRVDADYFNLGGIPAGKTIFLSLRLPGSSSLNPVLEVRNSLNNIVSIAYDPSAAVARLDVTSPDTYYAVVLGSSGSGPDAQYLLDASIWPTIELTFVDLSVSGVTIPASASSGQTVHLAWTVENHGTATTGVATWYDRVVLSSNERYGDGDDIPLTSVQHTGLQGLGAGEHYTAGADVQLPLGHSGNYWIFVDTDQNNVVFEYLYEGNNIGQSASQMAIALTPAADLEARDVSVPMIG